jgi:hypothetical protein
MFILNSRGAAIFEGPQRHLFVFRVASDAEPIEGRFFARDFLASWRKMTRIRFDLVPFGDVVIRMHDGRGDLRQPEV